MKILFNNIHFEYKKSSIQKQELNFCARSNNLQRSPLKDSFLKQKYAEETMLESIEGSDGFLEESKEMLRATLAGTYYLNEARENLTNLKNGYTTIDSFNGRILPKIGPKYRALLEKTLENSQITTTKDLAEIAQIFETLFKNKSGIITHGKAIIEIYGELDNPKDIVNFPEILDEMNFKNEFFDGNYDYQETVDFMKFFGAKNENEFFKIFSHLAPEFNDFEGIDDKLNAFEYIKYTYPIKRDMISFIKNAFIDLKDLDVDEFYKNNADIIDYLYRHNQKNMFELLQKIMLYIGTQEPISPTAINSISELINAKTPKGKVELYELLVSEQITGTELNEITKQTYYEGISGADVIYNRKEIIDGLIDLFNANEYEARAFYASFAHILNAINKEEQRVFILDPILNLVDTIKEFDLHDDKEFLNFYLELTKNSSKSSKNKKGHQKVSQKDILNFIDLLSFSDSSMARKYEKDKKYPLYAELKKRKAEFEKAEDKIERELKKQEADRYFLNSLDIFVDYYDLFKSSKNIESFVKTATAFQKIYYKEKMKADFTLYDTLSYHFNDKKALDEFLSKNGINLERQSSYDSLCMRILVCLYKNKDKEEIKELSKKLSENNFIKNSKNQLSKFANSKTDEELQTIFEIILEKNISSIQELNKILKPYLGKQKQISKLLTHFKAQNMTFESYLNKLAQIQKDLSNFGFPITINNDNIDLINFEELKGSRLNLTQACALANKILGINEGNFTLGLNESCAFIHPKYSAQQISKEITASQIGRYKEAYHGFINQFNLSAQNFGFNNPSKIEYQDSIQAFIKNNLFQVLNFINSDDWLWHTSENKIPNLTLHARMRMIDRFILQENKSLFSVESIEELKNITKAIYTKTPHKMEKTKNSFSMYFIQNDYEIKAVFSQNGELLTVAKNKL